MLQNLRILKNREWFNDPTLFSADLSTFAHSIIGPEEQIICEGIKWA